MLGRDH